MKRHFDEDLKNFNADILKMANLTEHAITAALDALQKQDPRIAEKAIKGDTLIDSMELIIEEKGIDLLALHQPMATDLRMVTTGLKVNSELERIADLAVSICERIIEAMEYPTPQVLPNFPRFGELAKQMTRDAIEAYVNKDAELARKVILADPEADDLKSELQGKLINDHTVKDTQLVGRMVPLVLVVRHLERICDHATYIAEDVIFMIEAKMVRHHRSEIFDGQKDQ